MARGIMADKRDNVASSPTATSDQHNASKTIEPIEPINPTSYDAAAAAAVAVATTSCSCTKISIMHLFHEMKQQFPTVPDNVVCECVSQNCHNRSACIDSLEDYPNSANVYPAALRNQPIKKKISNGNQQRQTLGLSILANNGQTDTTKENVIPNIVNGIELNSKNTLNLTNLNCCTQPMKQCRPTRQAPPPPSTISPHQQQKSLSNHPNLNLSVNVIVSTGPSQQIKPKQPLSHCSFTLHQPSNNNNNNKTGNISTTHTTSHTNHKKTTESDNEMDVPSLRYTSSAYDADIGYQSRLEITVAGTNPRLSNDTNEKTENTGNCISLRRMCETTSTGIEHNFPNLIGSSEFIEESMSIAFLNSYIIFQSNDKTLLFIFIAKIVHHQILCKQKLVLELEKDRKRLERMQRELLAIQAPALPVGGLDALNFEIEELRNNCKMLAQQVEEAGPAYGKIPIHAKRSSIVRIQGIIHNFCTFIRFV